MCNCYPYLRTSCTSTDVSANPCTQPAAQSTNLAYVGADLANTGINNCDTLSVAIQKIDAKIGEILAIINPS